MMPEQANKKTITILVAEDDDFLSRVLIDKLEKEGFATVHAIDGEDALQKITQESIDLAILDLIMPKKNGFDVIDELKKNEATATIPVIVLSNLGQKADLDRAMEKGIAHYFIKSDISLASVVEKVRACLPA